MLPSGATTEAVPTSTILPSGWIASPAATSLEGPGTLVMTSPPVPKRRSRLPLTGVTGHAEPRDRAAAEGERDRPHRDDLAVGLDGDARPGGPRPGAEVGEDLAARAEARCRAGRRWCTAPA